MYDLHPRRRLTSFQLIILGFSLLILAGTLLLMLPVSARSGLWTRPDKALFTATSAVCVTGLVVYDTATYWTAFGQAVILLLIQAGGLGIITVTAFIAAISGRKLTLLQRETLQESLSAEDMDGLIRMTVFIFKAVFMVEMAGAVIMLPSFCKRFGQQGVWMSVFHSVSAFCNAGFDLMGDKTGQYSSLTSFAGSPAIVAPVALLIVVGGLGFVTWEDIASYGLHIRRYRMQSKVILTGTVLLILLPALYFYFNDFATAPAKERFWLALFQSVTPRTAGFNTADLTAMTDAGRTIIIMLMLVGGAPGSTAGGMKITTCAVLLANVVSVVRREKSPWLFDRRIEDNTIKSASTLLLLYLILALAGAFWIATLEKLPMSVCLFETASAIGTVGLSLGLTPGLSLPSHLLLTALMFIGRVGGLTLVYAAVSSQASAASRYPVGRINVG